MREAVIYAASPRHFPIDVMGGVAVVGFAISSGSRSNVLLPMFGSRGDKGFRCKFGSAGTRVPDIRHILSSGSSKRRSRCDSSCADSDAPPYDLDSSVFELASDQSVEDHALRERCDDVAFPARGRTQWYGDGRAERSSGGRRQRVRRLLRDARLSARSLSETTVTVDF